MRFIETLGCGKCFLCGVAETAVGFTLQFGQIEQLRTIFLLTIGLQLGHGADLPSELLFERFGLLARIQTVGIAAGPVSYTHLPSADGDRFV